MATLDRMAQERSGKKKETGLAGAVASTEKIRQWVSSYLNSSLNTFFRMSI